MSHDLTSLVYGCSFSLYMWVRTDLHWWTHELESSYQWESVSLSLSVCVCVWVCNNNFLFHQLC